MGQYFYLLNIDRQEYVVPWDVDTGGKAWEWFADPKVRVLLNYLMVSGPVDGSGMVTNLVKVKHPKMKQDYSNEAYRKASSKVAGMPFSKATKFAGRWAGDSVALVGDYDETPIFKTAYDMARENNQSGTNNGWTNISFDLIEEVVKVLYDIDDLKWDVKEIKERRAESMRQLKKLTKAAPEEDFVEEIDMMEAEDGVGMGPVLVGLSMLAIGALALKYHQDKGGK